MPTTTFPTSFELVNPLTAENFIALLNTIINGLIQLAIPIAVIIIIWAGVLYMVSAGSDKIKMARKALIYAVLGFGILLISSGIVAIIQDFLGVSPPPLGGTLPTPTPLGPSTFEDVLTILTELSGWLFAFAVIAGVAMIIVAGLGYIFARGNAEQAGKALRILFYSVIGIAIVAGAWAIINIVSDFLTGEPIFGTLFGEARAASLPTSLSIPTIAPTGGPQTLGQLLKLFSTLTGWLFAFAVIAGVGAIVAGGIMFLFSGGDSKRVQIGAKMLLYAVLGVAIAGLAWGIVNIVGNILFGETFFP